MFACLVLVTEGAKLYPGNNRRRFISALSQRINIFTVRSNYNLRYVCKNVKLHEKELPFSIACTDCPQ